MNPKLGIVLLFITFLSFSAAATLERVLRTSGTPPQPPYHHHQGSSSGVKYGSGYGSYYHPRAKCPKLSAPVGGKVNVTGQYLGHKAIYSCNKGYVLVGFHIRLCIGNGTWSGMAPICKRVNCGPLPHIANGAVSIHPDTRLGSTATYTCNSGYKLVGNDTRTCLVNGKWSGQEPVCRPVDCGDLDNPMNGWVHISPNTLFGGQALYRCKLGYELSSDVVRTCQASGQWSGSAPTCDPIDCGDQPTSDPNGQIESTEGTSLGDKTTYSCNTGYFLVGSATIYCQNDKTYSDDAPTCQPVDCGAPDPADPNGSMQFNATTLGSTVVYSCNAGYTLVGNPISACQPNGKYSSEAPICQPIDCGTLKKPANGGVTFYPGTTFPSTATFQCRPGFKLVGSSTRSCMADGEWSGMQPVCQKIQCPKLKPPRFGKIYTSGRHPGAYVVYHCSYGYRLNGSRRRVCLHTGHWSGSDRDCVKSDHYGGPVKSHAL